MVGKVTGEGKHWYLFLGEGTKKEREKKPKEMFNNIGTVTVSMYHILYDEYRIVTFSKKSYVVVKEYRYSYAVKQLNQ
jgi:hypothetical protein